MCSAQMPSLTALSVALPRSPSCTILSREISGRSPSSSSRRRADLLQAASRCFGGVGGGGGRGVGGWGGVGGGRGFLAVAPGHARGGRLQAQETFLVIGGGVVAVRESRLRKRRAG